MLTNMYFEGQIVRTAPIKFFIIKPNFLKFHKNYSSYEEYKCI